MTVYSAAQLLSDEDRDGLAVLTEIALGRDPASPQTNGRLPSSATSGAGLPGMQFQLPVNPSATGGYGAEAITCLVRASDDLTTWETVAQKSPASAWAGPAVVETDAPLNGFVTVRVFLPAGEERRFLRLEFVHSP